MAPIALMSIYSEQIASESVRELIRAEDLSATGNVAIQVQQDMSKTVALAEAFGESETTVRQLRGDDVVGIVTRLKGLTLAFPALESAMLWDANGKTVYRYPTGNSSTSLHASLMQSVATSNRPGISPAVESDSGSVVMVGAPVTGSGARGSVVALAYRTGQIERWLRNIELPEGGSLFVLDQRGIVIARNGLNPVRTGDSYATLPVVQQALNGTFMTSEFMDPYLNRMVVATLVPVSVGRSTWVIVAEKTTESAYRDLKRVRFNIGVAGAILTLVTLVMVITISRIQRRNARLARELGEKNLRLGEAAAIVETSNDAIVGFGRDGRIRTWNSAAEKMYGFLSSEVIGESVKRIIPKEKADEFAMLLSNVTGGQTIQNIESVRMRKDGTLLPVSITLSPIRAENGTVVAVSSIDRDITERRKLEQMKDDFISFVSHQLKAPVTAMRWTLENITDGEYGPLPEGIRGPIEELRSINTQNFQLINDILNASRIDRGVIAVETKPTKMKDVVERALRDYRTAIERAGLTLTVLPKDEDLTVLVDLEKMAEAVTNSLSNAIKHTKKGGITVRCYRDGSFGCIDVTDSGEGMPQAIIDKLFTRSGILGTNTVAEKSAGLGLYIAKHFMELQGGDIRVTSVLGKGTTFTYRVPLANI